MHMKKCIAELLKAPFEVKKDDSIEGSIVDKDNDQDLSKFFERRK